MPSVSKAQARLMAAAAHTKGGYGGVSQSVGKDFNEADKGTGILNGHLGKPRFRYSHKTHRYVRSKYHG